MPRRNKRAGQPNREAQKNRHAYRVATRNAFKATDKREEREVKRA